MQSPPGPVLSALAALIASRSVQSPGDNAGSLVTSTVDIRPVCDRRHAKRSSREKRPNRDQAVETGHAGQRFLLALATLSVTLRVVVLALPPVPSRAAAVSVVLSRLLRLRILRPALVILILIVLV